SESEAVIPAPAAGASAPIEDERIAIAPSLWLDPDVRWLTGAHEAEGRTYILRERYEELLWWMSMPSLLRLAGEPAPDRAAVEELSRMVAEALATAEAAGYRIDVLLGSLASTPANGSEAPQEESQSREPDTVQAEPQQESEAESSTDPNR
ncbi:MAG: hypothetical protein WBE72_13935, partial [Terracidiphilus sp.]